MYLKTADGKQMADLIRDRLDALCEQGDLSCDEDVVLEEVLAQPDISWLLECLWDDESGKTVFGAAIEGIRQEVARGLRERGCSVEGIR
jgi:hypothetical protein